MARRISQRQIAEDLGVSQSLVSLVLNGRQERISEEKYKRIWEHAVKSGYAPKGMVPGHAPNGADHSPHVGVVLRAGIRLGTHSNTFSHVHHGLYGGLRQAGMGTVFLGSEGELDEAEFLRVLEHRNPLHGIVIFGEVQVSFVKAIRELHNEVVSVFASYPGLCHSVLPNERQAIEQLVEHLVDIGHTEFAWLGGNPELGRSRDRRAALMEALHVRANSIKPENVLDVAGGSRQTGHDAASELHRHVGSNPMPTAWICYNGLMARGAIQFAMQHDYRIPEDISIVAVDMTRVCDEIHPYLTSASSDPERIGAKAAELLLKSTNLDEDVCSDLVLPSRLVVRETSVPPAARPA